MRPSAVVLIASVVFAGTVAVANAQAPSTGQVVLVELFTSEGCSSCPPADALLRKLDRMRTESGQLVVGISEHVTYWNNLGWSDPFSSQTYTDRQDAYGHRFTLDSVYTPQVVVNGEKEALGSDGAAILKAISSTAKPSAISLSIDSVAIQSDAKTLSVTFAIAGHSKVNLDIFAVVADDAATSSVLKGENSGRTLKHVSVARSLIKVASLGDAKTLTVSIPNPGLVKGQPETKRHLILFAQERGLGRVVAIESKEL